MLRKILISLSVLVLVILPFLIGVAISKYSPYLETNSFQLYVIISTGISVLTISTVLLLFKYFQSPFEKKSVGGIFLFLLLYPIVGISGLAAAPDLSLKMIEHPEREHLRYFFLFVATALFAVSIVALFRSNSSKVKNSTSWIMGIICFLSIAEFVWEFSHHYLYPEALKEWISQGKNIVDFDKSYDNSDIVNIGVIGRYFQYASVMLISINLYRLRQIKIWSPIISVFLSLLGIISATLVFITQFHFPKGFEFLMLFFIPGIPFVLLFWIGVALLTKFKNSEVAAQQTPGRKSIAADEY